MGNLAEQEKQFTEAEFFAMDLPPHTELHDYYIYYMSSPSAVHQDIQYGLGGEIRDYIKRNGGNCKLIGAPFDVRLADGIIVQPDLFITCDRNKIGKNLYNGAPDWVIEIVSPTNSENDYEYKLWEYRDNGVHEYWIVDPQREKVIVYLFNGTDKIKIYSFTDTIPVDLYKSANEPLVICIKKLEY